MSTTTANVPVQVLPPDMNGAAAGSPPPNSLANQTIEFDPHVQLGRTGLKQYGGFIFEDFQKTLRGKEGAKAYREVVDNSPLVGGILRLLTLTMRQVNKSIQPFSDAAEDKKRAERVDQALDDMSVSWPDLMAEITTMLAYGYAPMEIVWKTCQGPSEDGATNSRYSDGLIAPRKIFLLSQDSLFRWDFDQDGGVRAMIQLAPPDYVMRTIPIEKMLLFRPHIEKGNPEGTSLLRSGYFSWVMIKRLVEFEAIRAERNATGFPLVKLPGVNMRAGATADQIAVFTQCKKLAQNLKTDDQMGVAIPSDVYPGTNVPMFDVKLMGIEGRADHVDYGAIITRHEVRLAISMLADIMLLGHDKVGSFSLSHDKRSLLADAMGAWLDAIVGVFNRHFFPRLFSYNGWPLDRLCKMTHGGVQDDDLEALADSVQKLGMAGMPLFPDMQLENHIREEMGWPERTEDDELAQHQEEQDAAAAQMRDAMQRQPAPGQPGKDQPKGGIQKFRGQARSVRGAFHPRTGTVMTALQLLADRGRVGHGDDVHHGFRIADPPPYDVKAVTQDAVERAPLERVQMHSLIGTQPTVRREQVRRFIENPGLVVPGQRTMSGRLEDRPVVVRAGDKQYLHDGHHRMAASSLLGNDSAMARVLELDPKRPDPIVPANQGQPAAPDVSALVKSLTDRLDKADMDGFRTELARLGTRPDESLQRATVAALNATAEALREKGKPANDPALAMIAAALKTLSERDDTPNVDIHVDPTPIHFDPVIERPVIPPTTVHNYVETKAPDVKVDVAAPNVTVQAPEIPQPKRLVQEIRRDGFGQIESVVERPAREDE